MNDSTTTELLAPLDASLRATLDHIDRLIRKRDRLDEAIEDSFSAAMAAIGRSETTPLQAVELYNWSLATKRRGPEVPRARLARIAEALGLSLNHLQKWAKHPETIPGSFGGVLAGHFPVGYQWVPGTQVPTVYVLYAETVLVYVGRSQNLRERLKAHWARRVEKPGLDSWSATICFDHGAAVALEADLIRQHSPRHNRAGNRFRSVS